MSKNIKYLVLLTIITCIVTGCNTTTKTRFPSGKVKAKNLNYLGQSEISASYRRYLGVIHSIDSVNGREYIPYESEKYKLGCRLHDNRLKKAAYKVHEEYPAADYFEVSYERKVTDHLFLGSEIKSVAVIRAYRRK